MNQDISEKVIAEVPMKGHVETKNGTKKKNKKKTNKKDTEELQDHRPHLQAVRGVYEQRRHLRHPAEQLHRLRSRLRHRRLSGMQAVRY